MAVVEIVWVGKQQRTSFPEFAGIPGNSKNIWHFAKILAKVADLVAGADVNFMDVICALASTIEIENNATAMPCT